MNYIHTQCKIWQLRKHRLNIYVAAFIVDSKAIDNINYVLVKSLNICEYY